MRVLRLRQMTKTSIFSVTTDMEANAEKWELQEVAEKMRNLKCDQSSPNICSIREGRVLVQLEKVATRCGYRYRPIGIEVEPLVAMTGFEDVKPLRMIIR